MLVLSPPQRGGAFDEHVANCPSARGSGVEHRARERARARTRLDDHERVGPVETDPPGVEGARQHRAEQRPHLGAGDEVAPGTRRASGASGARVEAELVVVERELDQLVETQGAEAVHPLGHHRGYLTSDAARSPKCANACG